MVRFGVRLWWERTAKWMERVVKLIALSRERKKVIKRDRERESE